MSWVNSWPFILQSKVWLLSLLAPSTKKFGRYFKIKSILYSLISDTFQRTLEDFTGAVFVVSAGFSVVALIGSFYVSISLKGRKMADVAFEGAKPIEEKPTKMNAFVFDYEAISHI